MATETAFPAEQVASLTETLRSAVARAVGESRRVDVLFSGGLDSAVVVALLPAGVTARLVTVGVRDSHDLAAAREGARWFGRPWLPVEVGPDAVARALDEIHAENRGLREPYQSVAVALRLALQAADAGRVLCGQGADELFLGYAHFEGLTGPPLAKRIAEDLRRLLEEEWPRTERVAQRLGRSLASPYLDPEVVAAVGAVDAEDRRPAGGVRKGLLRAVGRRVGLPEGLAAAPKKAIQYGSGVSALVRRARPAGPPGSGPLSPGSRGSRPDL